MQDLMALPEFDYGCPSFEQKWFALWCPLLDCFVLVSDNLPQLTKIQALTVSKILTVLVRLDLELHENNIIDNSCACNWTLPETEAINFTLVLRKNFHQHTVSHIIPSTIQDNEQVNQVQVWLFFVWRWIKYIENHLSDHFSDMAVSVFDCELPTPLSKNIYKILLLHTDPVEAEKHIQELIDASV